MADRPDSEVVAQRLGRTIRARRAWLDLTQEHLGQRAGLSTNYVGSIERGDASPTVDTLVSIAAGLEMPLVELIADLDDPT